MATVTVTVMPTRTMGTEPPAATTTTTTTLQMMWLASPTLPVGGYSYSEGLESAVAHAAPLGVADEAGVQAWLLNQLALSWARSEARVMLDALAATRAGQWSELQALNDWVLQTRETHELRRQTEQMGRSLALWWQQACRDGGWPGLPPTPSPPPLQGLLPMLAPAPTWPVMWGVVAACTAALPEQALQAFGFGWAEAQTQAAIKATPLGQTAGQRVLAALVQALPAHCEAVLQAARSGLPRQSFSPVLAILSSRHETQFTRIFRS